MAEPLTGPDLPKRPVTSGSARSLWGMAQESEPADLLDRWLTHREQGGAARTPVAGAVDSGSATDVDAEDPLFDESFEPAPEEVEAPLFEASAPQQLQLDFEPVIIPSARRRQERAGSRREIGRAHV